MQPQYFPQQPPQYGVPRPPGPMAPPGPGNYQQDNRPSPVGTPGNYQQQGPPRGPVQGYANGAPDMQPNHLTSQMSGMSLGHSQHTSSSPGFPAKVGDPAANFPPAVNGSVNGSSRPPSGQSLTSNSRPPASFPPGQMPPQPGQMAPKPGQFPGQGQFPHQPTGQFPSHPAQMAPQLPPQGQQPPPHMMQGQVPPNASQPNLGQQMPPQGLPHMPPSQGHMPPQGPPKKASQPGQMPLTNNQFAPQMPPAGNLPPNSGQFPSPQQPAQFPPLQDQRQPPPPQTGASPGGNRPPSAGFPQQPQQQQMRGFPPQQQPGFSPTSGASGFPPSSGPSGFPPTSASSGFPPTSASSGFPPTSASSGFPPTSASSGFPPTSASSGFPPTSASSGFPPQPAKATGFPPQPGGFGGPNAQAGYPQGPGFPPQQPYPQNAPPMAGQYPGNQQPMGGQYQGSQPVGNQYPGGQPMGGQYPPAQPQQARRLDPDQMPSPIQVIQDDQRNRSGVFVTNQKGLMPPIATTDFTVHDQGHCSPRFMRSTMYNVPATQDMMKQGGVPFSLVISPLAVPHEGEMSPPIVDMGEVGPVRCIRCKAYMCPYMQFVDGGRRFHCLFCKATTDVPAEYFQHLDHTGQRVDRYERPELVLGCYEFVATKDYCRNNKFPQPPAYIFLIDVSYNNVKSGLVDLLCARMKEVLRHLPRDEGMRDGGESMRVGFITYSSSVHFYNVKGSLAQAQMLVVGDVSDMFMPLLDGFLVTPEEAEQTIDSLMAEIPTMFRDTRDTETLLAPAVQAGLEALKAADRVGKLLVFHSSLPIAEAPGKLKNRDDRKLLGTDKEKTVLSPQNKVYNELAQDCAANGCAVDLFVFNNSYVDIATIGQVAKLTGGEVFKYTYFQADIDGGRLVADVTRAVSRPTAFDAIMRVRTSTGVRPTDFYGHFFMQNTTDIELAAIDCDKAIAIEVKHDDSLTEEDGVYIQVALLYTSCGGQRRLRILNLGLKTCTQLADLYRSCDLDTVINFYSKQTVSRLLLESPKPVKDYLVSRCAYILAAYRKNCASPSSAGQLILPECMKLLPLYVNCLLKSDAIAGGSEMTLDDRSFAMSIVTTMTVPDSVGYFYPRLIPLTDDEDGVEPTRHMLRCSVDKLQDDAAYILENGVHLFLWIGLNTSPAWLSEVFGVSTAAQVDTDRTHLPELDNETSARVRQLVERIRVERHRAMRLTIVRQRDKMELVFKHFLVEDRGLDSSPSYVDFLCHMHKEIRSLLS